MMSKMIKISILVYDDINHKFFPDISMRQVQPDGTEKLIAIHKAKELGYAPSDEWMNDYHNWNDFENNPNGSKGHPVFESVKDLYAFNKVGEELVERLEQEMTHKKNNVEIEPFQPVYSSIEVGDAVSAWWHVRDRNYKFITPIQQLPVSAELKSRLMGWRMRKNQDWLDKASCNSYNQEGTDLEEHILWELNVQFDDSGCGSRRVPSREDTTESISSLGLDEIKVATVQ